MVATRHSLQPSALPRRRQNPARNSRNQITQLADLSSDSDDLSGDDATVSDSGAYSDSDGDADGFGFGKVDADETPQALALPLRRAPHVGESSKARRKTTQSPKKKTTTTKSPSKRQNDAKRKRRDTSAAALESPKRIRTSGQQLEENHPQSHHPGGVIPDWRDTRIPVECWEDIFYYASYAGSPESLATNWLLLAATTCRHFTEPALSTLYRRPIIKHASKAKKFAALLEQPPSETRLNYRVMIEDLYLDIHIVPPGLLYQIIHPLPRLKELILLTPFDQAPYRELDRTIRWHYPEDVFKALLAADPDAPDAVSKAYPTYLKSWEWSARLVGGYVANSADLSHIHQLQSFSTLSRISFTNFQVPSLRKREPRNEEEELQFLQEDNAEIDLIAASISKLPLLQHLVFESSTVMNYHMLPKLPCNLAHLELINCWEVKADDLAAFLRIGGKNMRILSLHHNQSLDLSFLRYLAETCPQLRELDMNLAYYRIHESGNDSDPMYEHALLPDQIPKWPPSIRAITIEHIRGWSVEAAEMFLQTLLDNAQNLPNLRHLSIKTMLDISWKARATMRKDWGQKMERVFLRRSQPPSDFKTLQPVQPSVNEATPSPKSKRSQPPTPPSRRSGRIAASSESGVRSGRAKGLRHSGETRRQSYRDPDTDEDDFDATASEAESEAGKREDSLSANGDGDPDVDAGEPGSKQFVQGMCRTVNILFDNQKVRELQYGMEDFQSENDDSEDEWDGDYESDDPVLQF
ncbi:hypothetical protein K4F52_008879 [Lecanicillium sp. MT-2017a]|nr:hypothetical protein K4F52_008879 [Lecanicillium sp. MT-2017a]